MFSQQPTVLVIGATGQTGRLIVADLKRDPGNVRLRLAAHKEADVERLKSGDYEAVHLDLDDVKTFGPALAGVDRLYLLTGYTVAMLHQSKTLVDAAKKAGVSTSSTKASSGSGIARTPLRPAPDDRNLHQGERPRLD